MGRETQTGPADFDAFWQQYPRKIGKLDALKAYAKARRLASPEELQDGLQRFLSHLPRDMQFIPHAGTWLNQGRWMDEYTTATSQGEQSEDFHAECLRIHGGACQFDPVAHRRRKLLEARTG